MLRENLSRYLWILQINLWLSHGVNMLLAFLFLALAPIIFSINDLTYSESARITEQYVSVIGIFLLTPIFRPESIMILGKSWNRNILGRLEYI